MTKDEFYFVTTLTVISISLCALSLTIWQGYMTRKHFKLSIKPSLNFRRRVTDSTYELTLHNNGLGPARILNNQWYICDQAIEKDLILNYIFTLPTKAHADVVGGKARVGNIVPIGGSLDVLKIKLDCSNREILEKIRLDFRVKIEYESLYNEKCKPAEI